MCVDRPRPGLTLVVVTGEVDLASVAAVERTLLDAVTAAAGQRVVVDLNGVRFLGMCGLGILLAAEELSRSGNGALQVVLDPAAPAARTLRHLPAGFLSLGGPRTGARTAAPLTGAATQPVA